jgi:hypothetical protein
MTLTGLSLTNRSNTASNATAHLRDRNLSWRSTEASTYFLGSEQIDHRLPSRMLVGTLKGVALNVRQVQTNQASTWPTGLVVHDEYPVGRVLRTLSESRLLIVEPQKSTTVVP